MSTHEQLCRQFSVDEIKAATNNFDDEQVIGKGGFGSVYLGMINNGEKFVAIKRLSCESTQGETEFLREIETLSKLQHDNLVRLEGYCNEPPEKILVYEYMPNGTLVDLLYKRRGSATNIGDNQPYHLTWEERLNISIGAAQGLDFLHRGVVPRVIHRDIKDSNILLDSNLRAKIADFGLAKLVKMTNDPTITSVSTTMVKGTFGYLDPEYFYTQRLTTKTDVYAFGVVLLVVLSGRPAVDNKAVEDKRSLTEWATKCMAKKRLDLVIDPDLVGKISSKSLQQFVKIAQKCLCRQSEQRPTMKEVVAGLQLALKKQPTTSNTSNGKPGVMSSLTQMATWWNVKLDTQKKNPSGSSRIQKHSGGFPQWKGAISYSFDELKKCTNNFSYFNNVGSGGYGKVYRGTLPDGQLIAIKRAQQGSMQNALEFKTEIEFRSIVHHKNIVSLLGFCFEKEEQMIVYEYIPNGTLKDNLSGKSGILLDWMSRLKIALGAANGIHYLHAFADPPIIHGDIKSANILLDDYLTAKVTDFGLSMLVGETQVKGTMGYLDPEYYMTQQLTQKSDVYSFGVSLLELVTARTPIAKGKYIVREVKQTMDKTKFLYNLQGILDPNLDLSMPAKSLERFVDLALRCVEEEGANRPNIATVVEEIESIMELAGPNAESATTSKNNGGASEEYPYGKPNAESATTSKNNGGASKEYPYEVNKMTVELMMDKEVLNDIVRRLLEGKGGKQVSLSEAEIRLLCVCARHIFLSEPSLLEVEAPIKICGDIHGQYQDLLRIFEWGGFPPSVAYLFLGNYVDHGRQSLETICLLLAYKIMYPDKIFLLRGNHEDAKMNRIYGFYDECKRRYNVRLWKIFTDCFNCLPVAALVGEKIFCVHGGLSPDLKDIKQIKELPRPTDIPDNGLLCDLLWSDPNREIKGWAMNDQGVSYTFGPDKVAEFLVIHDLDLICRGNQVVEDGYEFFAERGLVTVFSAPYYRGEYDNDGAMLTIDESLLCSFQILKPPIILFDNKAGTSKLLLKKADSQTRRVTPQISFP